MKSARAAEGRTAATREQVRTRINSLRVSRQRSTLGLPEIIGLSISLVLLLIAALAYLLFLAPQRSRLESLQRERAQLQTQLRNSQADIERNTDTQASVEKILESLQNFETKRLALRSEISTAIIEELNDKIRRNGLARAQLSFTHFDPLAPGATRQRTSSTREAKEEQIVFPGTGISLTVEGSYPNLRGFIRDVEASQKFIVINAVELESGTGSATRATDRTAIERSDIVSLRLDLAAYFRRSGTSMEETPPPADAIR